MPGVALYAAGLFGYVSGGSVNNLGVENVDISGSDHVGGIAGHVENSEISNCHSTGDVSGFEGIGGIAGFVDESEVSNCYSTGEVNGVILVGGVVGMQYSESNISNCFSSCTVTGVESSKFIGGIAGQMQQNCTLSNCYSTGNVNGVNFFIGGIAGIIAGNCTVSNCYAIGNVNGKAGIGGIVGYVEVDCTISKCAALNSQVEGDEFVGRVAGVLSGTNTLTGNIAFDGMLNKEENTDWSNIGADNLDGESWTKQQINADGTLGGRFTSPVWTTESRKLPGLFGNTVEMPEHLFIEGAPVIITTTLPDGALDIYYYYTLEATGSSITWTIVSGNLPTGLELSENGVISGIPTAEGTFTFKVKAENPTGSAEKEFSIKIWNEVGIEEVEAYCHTPLRVYPNPVNYELKITNYGVETDNYPSVQIFDIMGRSVRAYCIRPNGNETETIIDVSHLMPGVYILKIGNKTAKFVKR